MQHPYVMDGYPACRDLYRHRIRQVEVLAADRADKVAVLVVVVDRLAMMKTIFVLDIGYAILAGSTLGFLGLGVSPPTPEWGYMIREALQYPTHWWFIISPGLALLLFVSAINFAGGIVTRSVYEVPGR